MKLFFVICFICCSCANKSDLSRHPTISDYLESADLNRDEKISFNEFSMNINKSEISLPNDLVVATFAQYDLNKDGFITEKELDNVKSEATIDIQERMLREK